MTTEEALAAIKAELDRWTEHSVRGMRNGNPAYFQGKIALITDLQSFITDLELDGIRDNNGELLRTVVEPNEYRKTYQVSTTISPELMMRLCKDPRLVELLAHEISKDLGKAIARFR